MFMQAYGEIISDDPGITRADEREVILQSIALMEDSDLYPNDGIKRVKAIHMVRRIWSYFMDDLASPENEIPVELKASLISVGIFILKHLEQMRHEKALNFNALVEISKTVEKGLR